MLTRCNKMQGEAGLRGEFNAMNGVGSGLRLKQGLELGLGLG